MGKERTTSSDPEYGVFVEVAKWHNIMICLPSWQEMLEYEYVRQKGEINMIVDDVQRYAFDRQLYSLVNWIQRCKELRIFVGMMYSRALTSFETTHGPRDTWITQSIIDEFSVKELTFLESKLQQQLSDVKNKRKILTSKKNHRK